MYGMSATDTIEGGGLHGFILYQYLALLRIVGTFSQMGTIVLQQLILEPLWRNYLLRAILVNIKLELI